MNELRFSLGSDRGNKACIQMVVGANCNDVAIVTPACVTNWPRVTGDGNFGTMWGPSDVSKAKFTLDLTDTSINGDENVTFKKIADQMEAIDEKLLDFVHSNQLKILGRKNLSRDEVKMLQIRTIRAKYDKNSGQLNGHSVQMSAGKFISDGMGGKYARTINICDKNGNVLPGAMVAPGDVVAATSYANQVYSGVGGDKFGIHWSFEDVSVVCQRCKLENKTSVPVFANTQYDFGQDYTVQDTHVLDASQFSD